MSKWGGRELAEIAKSMESTPDDLPTAIRCDIRSSAFWGMPGFRAKFPKLIGTTIWWR